MKLQSQKTRTHKGKEYFKHLIVIPNKIIEELGWELGEELEAEIKNKKLIIKKIKNYIQQT